MRTLFLPNENGTFDEYALSITKYVDIGDSSGSLCIMLYYFETEHKEWFPWAPLTINFGECKCNETCAYIDVGKHDFDGFSVVDWLYSYKIATRTGKVHYYLGSIYPEVKFDMNNIKDYCIPDSVARYNRQTLPRKMKDVEKLMIDYMHLSPVCSVPTAIVDFISTMPVDFLARFLDISTEDVYNSSQDHLKCKVAEKYLQLPEDVFMKFAPEIVSRTYKDPFCEPYTKDGNK